LVTFTKQFETQQELVEWLRLFETGSNAQEVLGNIRSKLKYGDVSEEVRLELETIREILLDVP
jgi:hypothetical protein